MIEPIGISHYGICVRDLDRSLAFYRDILGMQCGPIREQNMAEHFGDRQAQVYQKTRQSRRAASLTWGDGSSPWLVLSSHDDSAVEGEAPKLDQVGIHHICFSVKDTMGLAQHLIDSGVQLAGSLESYTRADGKVHAFYVFDPDGILVQFDDGTATG